jgi:hypothetical protein
LLRQEYELQRQHKELEDLRRQRYHDNKLRQYLRTHGQNPEPASESIEYNRFKNRNGDFSDPDRIY